MIAPIAEIVMIYASNQKHMPLPKLSPFAQLRELQHAAPTERIMCT
jgi:hypothetical protein